MRHRFILQGVEKLFLVYRPLFHHANGRRQLIISAEFADATQRVAYKAAKATHPSLTFELRTSENMTVEDILSGKSVVNCVCRRRDQSHVNAETDLSTWHPLPQLQTSPDHSRDADYCISNEDGVLNCS